eukprot:1798139-Heterocapsa_arctica.AAC.1
MAAKVFDGFRTSSLSPLDSSQSAGHFAQHLSLRLNLEPQKHCCFDSYLFVQNAFVMYACACTPVGPP